MAYRLCMMRLAAGLFMMNGERGAALMRDRVCIQQ